MATDRIDELFAPTGALSRVLSPNYEWRPEQARLAIAVTRTLSRGGVLLAEAPTGVGKSLAYLLPAVHHSIEAREPVLISTFTRALQDQIIQKELPRIRRVVDREVRVAVCKGRSNYLCRSRYANFAEEARGSIEADRALRTLDAWVQETQTGDLSDAPAVEPRDAWVLGRICGEQRSCSTSRCSAESGCFYKLSRKVAREAHLVIVNHALLLTDLFGVGGGLPEWTTAILDEAHHLPRATAEPLSVEVSATGLENALKGMGGRGDPGLTDDLRRALRGQGDNADRAKLLGRLREFEEEIGRLVVSARGFFDELRAQNSFPPAGSRLRYGPAAEIRDPFPGSGRDFAQAARLQVRPMLMRIEEVKTLLDLESRREPSPPALLEAERRADAFDEEISKLEQLLTPTERERVYWIEPSMSRGVIMKSMPIEVGAYLDEHLFSTRRALVLTSATLAIEGRFDHMARKLGLDEGRYEGLALPSPFALEEQVSGWVLTGGPEPGSPAYAEHLAQGIFEIARKVRRKSLVLFTSYEMLRAVESRARPLLADTGIRLHAQGVDGGQAAVRSAFLEDGPAVLFGAAGFWEGMDFPGAELEVLILARLPFLVPTDPLVEAISERIEADGASAFTTYYLPEAVTRFRQGFGRLIRRRGDRGLFIVTDSRLKERGYGRTFRQSVGLEFHVARGWDDIVSGGLAWFDRR